MLINMHTKKRIFLNMLLSQSGFAIISSVAIFSDSKVMAIVSINVIFAIIVAYINYSSMKRIVGGIDRIKSYLDNLMDYVFFRTNYIKKAQFIKDDDHDSKHKRHMMYHYFNLLACLKSMLNDEC